MKLKSKFILMGVISLSLMGSTKAFAMDNASIKEITQPKNSVSVDKTWKINFSKELNKDSITKDSIKVLNNDGQAVDISFKILSNEKSVEITPSNNKYKNGETYSIVITKDLKDKDNKPLKQQTTMKFKIEEAASSGGSSSGGSSSSSSGSTSGSGSGTSESHGKIDPSIKNAREGLLKIKPMVNTKGQKDLIDYLVSAIDKTINNKDYKINSQEVKKKYRSLPAKEQQSFEDIICSTFTIGELMDIRDALGV